MLNMQQKRAHQASEDMNCGLSGAQLTRAILTRKDMKYKVDRYIPDLRSEKTGST